MSIVAVRAITAGEELFVCYNYRLDQAPPWYRDLWHKHCHGGGLEHYKTINNGKVYSGVVYWYYYIIQKIQHKHGFVEC